MISLLLEILSTSPTTSKLPNPTQALLSGHSIHCITGKQGKCMEERRGEGKRWEGFECDRRGRKDKAMQDKGKRIEKEERWGKVKPEKREKGFEGQKNRQDRVKQVMRISENKRKRKVREDKAREGKRSKRTEWKARKDSKGNIQSNVTAATVVPCAVSRNCGAWLS